MKKNPKENCTRIANVFSEKYGRKIGRMTASRLKENIADIIEVDPIRPRVLKQTSITNFFKR